jgi:hypothetical protein
MRALAARRWKRGLGALCVLALSGCLFSSTPPERNDPTAPENTTDPNAAIVRGRVLLGELGNYHARPGWSVQVAWYKTAQMAPQDLITLQIVKTNSSGVFEARLKERSVVRAAMRPMLCSYDPTDPRFICCLDPRNPCGQCPEIWGAATVKSVTVGAAVNGVDLAQKCTAGP